MLRLYGRRLGGEMNERILVFEISAKDVDAAVAALGARRTDLNVIFPDDTPRLTDLAREGVYDLVLMNARVLSQIPRMIWDSVLDGACGGPVVIYRDPVEIDAVRSLMCRRHRCTNHPRYRGWDEPQNTESPALHSFASAGIGQSYNRPLTASMYESVTGYHLSRRQREILRLLAEGFSNKEIAAELGIQESTVKVQLKNVYRELKVKNRAQAASLVTRELSQIIAGNLN